MGRCLLIAAACLVVAGCATIDWRAAGQRLLESACLDAGNCMVACSADGLSPTGSSRCQAEPLALPAGR